MNSSVYINDQHVDSTFGGVSDVVKVPHIENDAITGEDDAMAALLALCTPYSHMTLLMLENDLLPWT